MVVFRWTKMHVSCSTGLLHAAGRLLNPAFRDYDHTADDLQEQFLNYLNIYFGDAVRAAVTFSEWQDYQLSDFDGDLFTTAGPDGTRVEKPKCSWAGDLRGQQGGEEPARADDPTHRHEGKPRESDGALQRQADGPFLSLRAGIGPVTRRERTSPR